MTAVARFGTNLRAVREARRMTQGQLAERMTALGVPLQLNLISRTEKGTRTPDLPEILALALALDVTPNRLLLTADARADDEIALSPTTDATSLRAWAWASGERPLDSSDWMAVHAFAEENRPHDVRDRDLRVREVKNRLDEVSPVLEAIEQVISEGVPPEIVFAALRMWERTRPLAMELRGLTREQIDQMKQEAGE
jgi:transcriptional regulator with XRE-family HTH domain